jgi:hypothetical protein
MEVFPLLSGKSSVCQIFLHTLAVPLENRRERTKYNLNLKKISKFPSGVNGKMQRKNRIYLPKMCPFQIASV